MHRKGLALLVAAAPILATAGPPEPAWLDLHDAPLRVEADGVELPRGTLDLRGASASLARVCANLGATHVGSTLEVDGLWGELRLENDPEATVSVEGRP